MELSPKESDESIASSSTGQKCTTFFDRWEGLFGQSNRSLTLSSESEVLIGGDDDEENKAAEGMAVGGSPPVVAPAPQNLTIQHLEKPPITRKVTPSVAGFSRKYPLICIYCLSLGLFLLIFLLPSIGLPNLGIASGNLISAHPSPSDGDILPLDFLHIVFPFLWCIHFVKRIFECLFVHVFYFLVTPSEIIAATFYHGFFAVWIAWSLRAEFVEPVFVEFLISGSVLFLLSEVGNFYCHWILRNLRRGNQQVYSHSIPNLFPFSYISCPHYTFEILSWLGFSMAVGFALSTVVFLGCSFLILSARAEMRHKTYKIKFDGVSGRELYPKNRKRIIPFIF